MIDAVAIPDQRVGEVSKICQQAWELQESRIRRIFERKSRLFLADVPNNDEIEWLALMQHHGAPTRLLDFTWSPYVAAFFALERATEDAAVWAINLPLLWAIHDKHKIDRVNVGDADPRNPEAFKKYYLPNRRAFVWQGDSFRMPQRVVAQSGTFLVSSHLGMTVEEILARYPGEGELLVQFVLNTCAVFDEHHPGDSVPWPRRSCAVDGLRVRIQLAGRLEDVRATREPAGSASAERRASRLTARLWSARRCGLCQLKATIA
jgi:hypothetical protein